ncbi:MAG TPA: diguanylate cyclase [Pirellulales bacterium]|nr:diguanylate cyclase [Pirellulales bacterium]
MASQPPTNERTAPSFVPVDAAPPSGPAEGTIRKLNSLIQQIEADGAADARPASALAGAAAENELVEARLGIASSLYRALRWKHEPTARHCFRVTLACSSWSTRMGLSPKEQDEIELAALLHDVGKIGVPDGIITKPGPLTPQEAAIMDNHWLMGQEILRSSCASPNALKIVAGAASWYDGRKSHLERIGGELPLAGRMLAIVDAFDAMMSDHVYRRAFSRERALNELYRCAGTQFDPELVKLFADARDFDPLKLRETVARRWLQVLEPEAASAHWQYNEPASLAASPQPLSVFQQRLVANMYDAVIFIDASLKIVEWNRGAERLTGVSGTSVYQRSWLPSIIELTDEHGAEFSDHECPVAFALRTGVQWLRRLKVRGRGNRQVAVDAHAIPVLCSDGITRGLALVLHDVSSEISLEARCENLKERATKDPLTQVANRAEFDRVHAQFVAAHLETSLPCSLVISDIDRFKQVNDTYGHQAGDEVIQSFARLLKGSCRPGDLVARYGGEEFVLLCADCDNAAAVRRAEELRKAFSQVNQAALGGRRVTASFGVTEIQPGDTPETMLRRADRALLDAKESGRNRVVQLGSGADHGVDPPLTAVCGPGGETVLAQRVLISEAPLAVCIEKARGFVSDHHGVIEQSRGNSLRVRVGQEGGSIFRRISDRPVALVMDLQFVDVEHERHRPAHLRRYGNARTRINLSIVPKRSRDRRRAQLQERARQLVISLRAYLMATEWELSTQPDARDESCT